MSLLRLRSEMRGTVRGQVDEKILLTQIFEPNFPESDLTESRNLNENCRIYASAVTDVGLKPVVSLSD